MDVVTQWFVAFTATVAGGVVSGYIVYRMTHQDDKPPQERTKAPEGLGPEGRGFGPFPSTHDDTRGEDGT